MKQNRILETDLNLLENVINDTVGISVWWVEVGLLNKWGWPHGVPSVEGKKIGTVPHTSRETNAEQGKDLNAKINLQ